ncbi:MAG: esterase family protein [Hydrogenibacillus sp.]|nr:esterase family protein [Hydrogenibacillus sp.]
MDAAYRRKVVVHTVDARCLGRTVDIRVFIPTIDPTVDDQPIANDVPLPIVYVQDGQHWFMYGRAATIAQRLISERAVRPFRLVGIDVHLPTRLAEYHPEGERNAAYRRFFFEELLPAVEARYALPTRGLKRVYGGDSLGGTVSFDLALDRPDLCQGLISLSTAFVPPLMTRLKALQPAAVQHLSVFQSVGQDETHVDTRLGTLDFVAMNRAARDLLRQKGIAVHYVERPGSHTWGAWQTILPDSLRHFFAL